MSAEITKKDIELKYTEYSFKDVVPGEAIIGQDKALGLLRLGLSMTRPGYNIFISGDDGSGRLTALKEEIAQIEGNVTSLMDAAYLFNMSHQDRPLCVLFPKGQASEFQEDLDKLGDGETTREALSEKWTDPRLQKFLETLPEKSLFPDAYRLNIVLDCKRSKRRPLVIEAHPSRQSLFGCCEKDMAPHLSIRTGSYQDAAGGFLVLDAKEITGNEELWTTLKRYLEMTSRALTSTAVQGEMMSSIRPYPIPMLTKVILLGTEDIYDKLTDEDETFLKFFKVSPEFDYSMEATEKNIRGTVSYLKKTGEKLLPQEDSAYHEILRFSSWVAENRRKLTTQLSVLGDLLEEADIDARQKGNKTITANNVMGALQKRDYYGSMAEEHINREIQDGVMVMSLKGKQVGVVNGLAVMDRGLSSFGTPCVISATVAPGTEGIVNIEHEAGLSGGIHDKGLLILEGYLRRRYAQTFPLSLYAGICFEQNYGAVDGDSASSAELYALLSAIGAFPDRQDIAVTASVNQMGEHQPVGAINENIQGFFNACST
ncbi:MAG: AAA family ATPase, partial [Spirochaetales bacterium]|nr:AAA family ATPase [Candidatus Physcosoma equi]